MNNERNMQTDLASGKKKSHSSVNCDKSTADTNKTKARRHVRERRIKKEIKRDSKKRFKKNPQNKQKKVKTPQLKIYKTDQ